MNIFGWLFRGNDITSYFLPDAIYFSETIRQGKFPIWNQWIFGGMPYLLDPQNLLWYPPNYIFLLMPVEWGFLILLIGHLVLAGWGIKKALGEFGIFGRLAIFGATMFVLSPKLISHLEEGNWSLVIAATWLPALYYSMVRRKWGLLVISLSALIINNLNIGYYAILFVVVYFLTRLNQKRSILASARILLKILIAVAVLTIPRWLPLILYGSQTVRAGLNEAPLPFWSWTKIVKSLFVPLISGHPNLQNEEILYLGLVPMLLVIFVLLVKLVKFGLGKESRFWIIWLGFVSLVAINVKTPLFDLIRLLPGFSLLRITTRPWIFTSLFMALTIPRILDTISLKHKKLAIVLALLIIGEFAYFANGLFTRRIVPEQGVPLRFYEEMSSQSAPVRAYCTTGCLGRLTAQKNGIAILGGNNPVQLTEFVNYLQHAGGYNESGYYPILPPYTTFSRQPQPNAKLLAKTSTSFVISPYRLIDKNLMEIDKDGDYFLYRNTVELAPWQDHYFNLFRK